MYKIDFFIGLPYAHPRQKLAEASTEHDDHRKAVAVAREKAQLILSLLSGKTPEQAMMQAESDEDYVDGKLTAAARQRLIDERLVAAWGPHPRPAKRIPNRQVITSLEVQLTSDTGQISLFTLDKPKALRKAEMDDWRPSGDYQAQILLAYGEHKLTIGTLEFAATTAIRALSQATEQARQLIDQLKKSPGLGFLTFNSVTIHVERVNTQLSFVEEEPGFDWTELNYPEARF